jgi:homoserine O-acetyltransferase
MPDYEVFDAGNVVLQSGMTYRNARLAYKTYGVLNAARSNAILYPTSFGAQHYDTEWLIKDGHPLDPSKFFIIIPNLFGNGLSSSPSNTPSPYDRGRYPHFTLVDNVRLQHRLLSEVFGIERLALVYGYSMGGQQALHWGALFPDMVERICAICATAKTTRHTWIFLEGMKSVLTMDPAWRDGWFQEHPVKGLRAMGRVWAAWGFSQSFYREELYRQLDASSVEDFLVSHWEARFLKRNADDLMAMLWTCQNADVSANELYRGDLDKALGAVRARTLVMPSESDLYFPVEDARREVARIPQAELVPIPSIWGHRAGNPQTNVQDADFIFGQVRRLLAEPSAA